MAVYYCLTLILMHGLGLTRQHWECTDAVKIHPGKVLVSRRSCTRGVLVLAENTMG